MKSGSCRVLPAKWEEAQHDATSPKEVVPGPAVKSPSGGAAGRRLGGHAVLDGTLMIARAFAETYRDVFDAPVPEPLVAILRQMESGVDRDRG
jgi:hypothetical protein